MHRILKQSHGFLVNSWQEAFPSTLVRGLRGNEYERNWGVVCMYTKVNTWTLSNREVMTYEKDFWERSILVIFNPIV